MRFSKEMGFAVQDDMELFARIGAADVLRNLPKNQFAIGLEQLPMHFSIDMWLAVHEDLDLLRMMKQLKYCFKSPSWL